MEPVTLRSDRLVLSSPTSDDVEEIFTACQDREIQRFTTVPTPYHRGDAEGFITFAAERWSTNSEATFAIRSGSDLAGMIGLNGITAGGAGEIGYWMTPRWRRKGVVTEAARAVIDWGFSDRGPELARIEWRAVVGNVASARVARSLGFHYEGLLRQGLSNSFGRDDAWIAGLLPADDRTPQPWLALSD